MEVVVADSGQVVIPEELRDKLGIVPQSVLDFHEEDGKLVAIKVTQRDPVSRVRGCLDLEMSTDEFLNSVRGDT